MTVQEYEEAIAASRLVRMRRWEDDPSFENAHPDHPLALRNRLSRIQAADEIRHLARDKPLLFSSGVLARMHRALFDCCAAVRESIARALFFAGDMSSVDSLRELQNTEYESQLVRRVAKLALRRITDTEMLYGSKDWERRVVVVSDSFALIKALYELADAEGGQVAFASPGTPDIFVYSGCVRVIDRQVLGAQAWDNFCAYLADRNAPIDYSEINDAEVAGALREIGPDTTPIIILESPGTQCSESLAACGPVVYIDRGAQDPIIARVREYMIG